MNFEIFTMVPMWVFIHPPQSKRGMGNKKLTMLDVRSLMLETQMLAWVELFLKRGHALTFFQLMPITFQFTWTF